MRRQGSQRRNRPNTQLQFESLEVRTLLAAALADGVLSVEGTDSADLIRFNTRGDDLIVSLGGVRQSFAIADLHQIRIDGRDGNDRIQLRRIATDVTVDGGAGDDRIQSGSGGDLLIGGAGDDRIDGGAGQDDIDGGAGDDRLTGGPDADFVLGGAGNDRLRGSTGEDRLDGGDGENTIDTDDETRPRRPERRQPHARPRAPGRFPSHTDVRIPHIPTSSALAGWDGPGQGGAHLTYYFGDLTSDLSPDTTKATLRAALDVWAQVADIVFTETDSPGLPDSIDFEFAAGRHGDGNPFDGPGGELAHAFLPVNTINTIAGDVHFDDAELWEVGDSGAPDAFDLMYVAVHEIGHALGLLHSDHAMSVLSNSVTADAAFAGLADDDVAAILALYGPSEVETSIEPNSNAVSPVIIVIDEVPTHAGGAIVPPESNDNGSDGTIEGGRSSDTIADTPTDSDSSENGTSSTEPDTVANENRDDTMDDTVGGDPAGDSLANDPTDEAGRDDSTGSDSVHPTESDEGSTDGRVRSGVDTNGDGVVRHQCDITPSRVATRSPRDPITRFDANDDCALSAGEVPDGVWERLVQADADGDGLVTAEELAATRAEHTAQSPLARFDGDSDGILTIDEVPSAIWERIVRADVNGDGVLTAGELSSGRTVRSGRHSSPGRGPRGRRG